MALLELENVHTYYGVIQALKGISLTVEEAEIVSLIGGNGAGKSTTLKAISGLIRPRKGTIRLAGEDLAQNKPHEIVSKGVVQVPEGRRVFALMSVAENLQMGAFALTDTQKNAENLERVYSLFPRLKERRKQLGGTLSGGEQQMLAMGRALMAEPKVLLLDEPSMGLAPVLVDSIFDTIQELNDAGTTILLVEQNARVALQIADRGYVLETGEIVLSGSAEELRTDETVQKAYLGIT
ncbi:MAG TPA: ABC transporter ATP-binding protein [Anaerolineales bacterium]|nr:ABC transporter ATP-binding protein [Anaerolineales bacterium]